MGEWEGDHGVGLRAMVLPSANSPTAGHILRLGPVLYLASSHHYEGVLLDIQQHFGVKDRGAGLLQSGEARLPSWSPNLAFYLVGIPCPSLPWS